MITQAHTRETIGLMFSGGLDSAILLGNLLAEGYQVQPFYVSAGCRWEAEEQQAVGQFLTAIDSPLVAPLVNLAMPVEELYGQHWSITGQNVPDETTPDEAVWLPARNPLLLLKPVLWCGQNGISQLALANLAANPFSDATPQFFSDYEAALATATGNQVKIVRPFADKSKAEILELAIDLPLHLTFSCLAPHNGVHCGACNKCAERARALHFQSLQRGQSLQSGLEKDPTNYACAATTAR